MYTVLLITATYIFSPRVKDGNESGILYLRLRRPHCSQFLFVTPPALIAQWMHRERHFLTFKEHVYWNKISPLAVKTQQKKKEKILYMYFPRKKKSTWLSRCVCDLMSCGFKSS